MLRSRVSNHSDTSKPAQVWCKSSDSHQDCGCFKSISRSPFLRFSYASLTLLQVPTVNIQVRCSRRLVFALCIGSVFLAGCGGGDVGKGKVPPLGKVSGTVKLDGKPLENAQVEFVPANDNVSIGMTDSSGYYTLDYNATNKGAVVGEHTVKVTTKLGAALGKDATEKVPAQYNTRSELKASVKAGDNKFDFDLKGK